jgi:hypothetical protein
MEIQLIPDVYVPSVDTNGNYIDTIPIMKDGLFCQCKSRKDKVYETPAKFSAHITTKTHQAWLVMLNQNKSNFYGELLQHKELVNNQRKIIKQMETELNEKKRTIDYLHKQLTSKTCDFCSLD